MPSELLTNELARLRELVDGALERVLPPTNQGPGRLTEAMRYSVMAGGKRLRPILALLWTEAAGGADEQGLPAACALELVHTYSLIHDDLPAMDNDDLRRGIPTSHKKFGEATAILAGDALLTLAVEVLVRDPVEPMVAVRQVDELVGAAGHSGMVAGQVADIEGEGRRPDRKLVELIHRKKTAALIRAACLMGVIAGEGDERMLERAGDYGSNLGLLFQITDDMLDESGSAGELGKTPGKDREQGKQTYPSAFGPAEAMEQARRLAAAARSAIADLTGTPAEVLRQLTDYLLERKS